MAGYVTMTLMSNVAILTTFRSADSAYSLNRVVQDQIKMFTLGGYHIKVFVAEGFVAKEAYAQENVELFVIPDVPVSNSMSSAEDATFAQDIESLTAAYRDGLVGYTKVVTHDLVYQPSQVKHQIAVRRVASERKDVTWFHWIHSATSPQTLIMERNFYEGEYKKLLVEQFPNSYYVFFNEWSKRRIAANFGVPVDRVKVVYHPTDIVGWMGMHDISKRFVDEKDLLSADMIAVYPARLDNGKNAEKLINLMISIRNKGYDTRTVYLDFHSNSNDPNDPKYKQRESIKETARHWEYQDHVYFMSEFSDETRYEVPHQVVRDMFLLSNIFMMPSRSESYSLVTQEAGLAKNLLLLNDDFPPFREIFGDANLFVTVGSNVNKTTGLDGETHTSYNPSEAVYWEDKALEVIEKFQTNNVLLTNMRLRKFRNLKYIWENQLRPLVENG